MLKTIVLLLYSSIGFTAELSLTLLNGAVDKVKNRELHGHRPAKKIIIKLILASLFYRVLFAWMDHHLDTTIGKVALSYSTIHYCLLETIV